MITELWFLIPNFFSIFYFPAWVFRKWRRNQHCFYLKQKKYEEAVFGQDLIFLDYSIRTHKFVPSK